MRELPYTFNSELTGLHSCIFLRILKYFYPTKKEFGRRKPWQKSWYHVTEKTENKEMLLTAVNVNKEELAFSLDKASLERAFKSLKSLKHPFIQPVERCEYVESLNLLCFFRPFCSKGSLRDDLFRSKVKSEYSAKYSSKAFPLKESNISTYGRQILEALLFLKKKGFPFPHLHSGNVLLDAGVATISEVEDTLLGLEPLQNYFLPNVSWEVQCFGKLLYELMTGVEADGPPQLLLNLPSFLDCKYTVLKKVVTSVLQPSGEPLQVEDLLKSEPFASVQICAAIPKATLSQKTADFLSSVRTKTEELLRRNNSFREENEDPKEKEAEEERQRRREEKAQQVHLPGTKKKKKNKDLSASAVIEPLRKGTGASPPTTSNPVPQRHTMANPPKPPSNNNLSPNNLSASGGNIPTFKPAPSPPQMSAAPPPPPGPPPPITVKELPPPQSGRSDLLASIRNADKNKLLKKVK